ncbi:glutamate-1-semialdehyde 2,1-aminomutase [Rubritalea squalenifaciens DSM 18772]|uniref:Glutamate-1-semialdehyde 2,1-aminomutase n=1 Tax=Rubritalea squalenifaciens DSM 18772 TaxID=1123071 RepID=A0A1M6EQ21_9BACT|nr:glutamate-1-semialdehyde 2,1-aminomutase [Rubritalea squalenifaciens]SHI87581.1 glutamate-1-semialdehyde 2,1-aminomutase [Rubritalea squalenifaciens DSM 18772]
MTGPLSQKMFAKAKTLIPGGVNSPVRAFKNVDGDPFFVRSASGCRIKDIDDKTYIDYVGTWGPAILGHAPIEITQTIHEVAKQGVSFGCPCPWEVTMAQTIVDWVPSVEKVRMVNSGTEATMSAIRLARGFTKRDKVIKFEGCYHGHVDHLLVAAGSGALTHGEPDSAGVPKDFSNQTIVLKYNDTEALQETFDSIGDQIAAVILEPFPANAGLIFPREGYLQFLRDITTKHGTVLIFDEVMTGFRLAKGGVQELVGITPDLTCMGKVIGGGLPVGAFGGRSDIMDHLAPVGAVYQAGTLSGNPLAMAAGLAQLKALDEAKGYDQLERLGAQFEAGLRNLLAEKGLGYTLHRVGSMFCLFFTEKEIWNLDDVSGADMEAFKKFFWALIDQGVYIAPSPYEAGFISLAHSTGDIDDTLDAMSTAFKAI